MNKIELVTKMAEKSNLTKFQRGLGRAYVGYIL